MEADFNVGSKTTKVSLDTGTNTISWIKYGFLNIQQSINVPISDVLIAKHKEKTWTLHYVTKTDNKWIPQNFTFTGENEEICEQWTTKINDIIKDSVTDRPKKLLVFINPDGGSKRGVKDYNEIAKPLLELVGIVDDVIITKGVDDFDRMIPDYKLTDIDGIICVGGDGTLMNVVTSLMKRFMSQANRQYDDPEETLVECPIRLGIFPAGTGNGLASMFIGRTKRTTSPPDFAASVLQTIFGHTLTGQVQSIHSNGKLVAYANLQCCFGIIGDTIKISEANRASGKARYASAMVKTFVDFEQPYDIKVEVLVKNESGNEEWVTHAGKLKMVNGFIPSFGKVLNYQTDVLNLFITTESAGRLTYLRQLASMYNGSEAAIENETRYKVQEYKLELNDLPEGSNETEHVLNIDGEALFVKPGTVKIKLHPRTVKVFGIGIHKKE